ncbi:hypothetical protein [Microbacterium sp. OR16]|uniref:hypothetical protein n=1 Tax=Microbacterium sp. OR16 TaxID=3095345 RepID=UPI0039B66C7B
MRSTRTGRRAVGIAAIVVLSVAVVALSTLALSHTRTARVAAADERMPVPAPSETSSPSPSTTPTPTTPAAAPRAEERFLSFSGASAWRATAGSCEGAAPVLQRLDGRGEWVGIAPRGQAIGEIVSLDAYADGAEFVAGVDTACTPVALRTFTAGEAWAPRPDSLARSRYITPGAADVVHTRTGDVAAPCAAASGLRARGEVVALICDGRAWSRTGDQWQPLAPADAVAVAVDDTDILIGHRSPECAGLAVTRVSGDASSAAGCAPGVDSSLPVAIAPRGDDIVVWAADDIIEVRTP